MQTVAIIISFGILVAYIFVYSFLVLNIWHQCGAQMFLFGMPCTDNDIKCGLINMNPALAQLTSTFVSIHSFGIEMNVY